MFSLNVLFQTATKTTTISAAYYEQNFLRVIRKFFFCEDTLWLNLQLICIKQDLRNGVPFFSNPPPRPRNIERLTARKCFK